MTVNPPTLYTTEEGAARLGPKFKPSTLRRLAAARKVDVTFIGGKYWWTDDQLRQVVEVSTRPAVEKTTPARKRRTASSAAVPSSAPAVSLLRPSPGARYGRTA